LSAGRHRLRVCRRIGPMTALHLTLLLCAATVGGLSAGTAGAAASPPVPSHYDGLCDASAAVALGPSHFVVADDERNTLVTYRRGQPAPVQLLDLHDFLGTPAATESDLEGSATVGQRVYWIASHGRNKNGKLRPARYRLFATDIHTDRAPPGLTPTGQPYTRLLDDLTNTPALKPYGLAMASQKSPEAPGGLNIEGLAATAQGTLLIGFRSPLVGPQASQALLVTLRNPAAVVDTGAAAVLGEPVALDLGGRGIRSIERVQGQYLIVAGPVADEGSFALYRWSGVATAAPVQIKSVELGSLRPEALFEVPGSHEIQLLSDDGGVATAGVTCKARPQALRAFRSLTVQLP
jgi:hypothetical protein